MPPRPPFPVRGRAPMNMGGYMRQGNIGAPMMRNGAGAGMRAARGTNSLPRQGSGGGILAKILGKDSNQAGGLASTMNASRSAANTASSGGLLKSLANPTAISGFLSNTQRVLNTAQQLGPMVQQYGPIIKNLPAMWKLYRGLKSSDTSDSEDNVSVESQADTNNRNSVRTKTNNSSNSSKKTSIEINAEEKPSTKGKSVPKIYV